MNLLKCEEHVKVIFHPQITFFFFLLYFPFFFLPDFMVICGIIVTLILFIIHDNEAHQAQLSLKSHHFIVEKLQLL